MTTPAAATPATAPISVAGYPRRNTTTTATSAVQGGVRGRGAMAAELDIAALYRRYGDMVLGRCRSLLGNEADAQEATQDVFLKVHRARGRFRGDSAPSTYLYRTATTTSLNWLRTRKRRREDMTDQEPAIIADSLLDRIEIRQLIDELLEPEDERTRACAIYHWMDGMTHEETGQMLGISGAAVRKRLSVFRKRVAHRAPWLEEP